MRRLGKGGATGATEGRGAAPSAEGGEHGSPKGGGAAAGGVEVGDLGEDGATRGHGGMCRSSGRWRVQVNSNITTSFIMCILHFEYFK